MLVFNVADVLCGQVLPLLQYLDLKCAKYAGSATNRSYMELVRNRTRAKVAASSAAAAKEQQNQATEAKYEVLRKDRGSREAEVFGKDL